MDEEEIWEVPDHLQGVLSQNWGGIEPNRTVTCMVLKAMANDRCKNLPPCQGSSAIPISHFQVWRLILDPISRFDY
ncbi:hypothetical protein TNCV_4984381 [Trichonephila clavipes]|nr:hypothetical protein TNCV_4984381 [Trichonephila clavipes]